MAQWTTSCPDKPGWYWVRGDARGSGGSEPFLRAASLYKMHLNEPGNKPDTIYIDGDNYKAVDAPFGGVYMAFWDEPIKTPGSFENEYEDDKWDVIQYDTVGSFLGQVDAPTYDAAYVKAKQQWGDVPPGEYDPNHQLVVRPARKKKGVRPKPPARGQAGQEEEKMTMPAEKKKVRWAYCKCCKQMAPVKEDGNFDWHDYPIMFDHHSVEGFSLGLCGMTGYGAPPEEKKKEGKTVDHAV